MTQRSNNIKCTRIKDRPTVDKIEIPNSPSSISICRCGLSKNFPFCDGSHNQMEKNASGLGPVIISIAVPSDAS